jgi:drug/metabolite transporter (DMT)-like permease
MKTVALVVAALLGFAGNSLICRLALAPGRIDAATFTSVRIAAGALALVLLTRVRALAGPGAPGGALAGSWPMAAMLFAYAALFSYAYLRVGAALGALVLFAAVQATMIASSLHGGERLRLWEWLGLVLALGGLAVLAGPGLHAPGLHAADLHAPDLPGVGLMALAGVAWGAYSLLGRAVKQPLAATAGNFARCLPFAVVLSAATWRHAHVTADGLALAAASGAITSGIGYALWYAALPALSKKQAAFAQLTVPVIAAAGAVLLLGETLTDRLLIAGAVILAGVAMAVLASPTAARKA